MGNRKKMNNGKWKWKNEIKENEHWKNRIMGNENRKNEIMGNKKWNNGE